MNLKPDSLVHRFLREESGQILPWVVILITMIFAGISALVVDVGRAVVAYHMLQASSDAAVMAGVYIMPTATSSSAVTNQAIAYSSVPGNKNASTSMLPNAAMVTGYPKLYCSSTAALAGAACSAALNANAIVVSQTLNLPMYFGSIIGVPTMTITATSTASMRGAQTAPYNIAIVIDTTASMQSPDTTTDCSQARIRCALIGVQSLLDGLSPCTSTSTSTTCTAYDSVSLFTYPAIQANTASADSDCSGSTNPTIVNYSTPAPGATWTPTNFTSSNTTYQVTTYLSDWSSNNKEIGTTGTGSFNNTSVLTRAAGASKSTGCSLNTGMQAIGGKGTYFAGAIYAATSSLVAQQAANPSSKNALIILSDGDANATSGHMTASDGLTLTSTGVYPSVHDQCHQAITAAQYAAGLKDSSGNPDTTVYTIAYGANTSSSGSCTSDSPAISACNTLKQMASSSSTFYSTDGTSGCAANTAFSGLSGIFGAITTSFTRPRLMANGTP